jgi:hypothetical protein
MATPGYWSSAIHNALRERYAAPAWALFLEVADGTGGNYHRSADALAMSLYPSRGLDLHGFEIKSHRNDWLNELKNPDKAEKIARYCDFWWLVAENENVVKLEEVPRAWGLLVLKGKSLRQIKKASQLKPRSLDRKFLAAILRRANEMTQYEMKKSDDKFAKDEAYIKAYEKGKAKGMEESAEDLTTLQREHSALKKSAMEFESRSGIQIDNWNGVRMGEAVKALMYLKEKDSYNQLADLADHVERVANEIRNKANALKGG